MDMTKLYIKNMVCPRCVKTVREELEKLNLTPVNVTLGEAELLEPPEKLDFDLINAVLKNEGFELLEDSNSKIVEAIKTEIIKVIQNYDEFDLENILFSKFLSDKLGKDYPSLSSLFSKVESVTIEQFVILQKIEKVKELLTYKEMNLSEIAYSLGYSSVQHLSRQFKQITGMTATRFMKESQQRRKSIDKLS